MDDIFKKAQNNPPHWFRPNAVYMITASTYQKDNLIHSPERKTQWLNAFLKAANIYNWRVIAWVVLHNHYRQVWWNYWDTCIRSEKDFNNRLGYIFWNPVKHGLVDNIGDYPFSSYKEYMQSEDGFDITGMGDVNDVPEF